MLGPRRSLPWNTTASDTEKERTGEIDMGKVMRNLLFIGTLSIAMQASGAAAQDGRSGDRVEQPASSDVQNRSMAGMQHAGNVEELKPELPKMGRAQEKPTGKLFHLEDLEEMALRRNPTLVQASAEVQASKARQQQSGLYPNPRVG